MRRYFCEPLEQRRLLAATPVFTEDFEGSLSGWMINEFQNSPVEWTGVYSGFGGVTAHSGQTMVYAAGSTSGSTTNPVVPSGTQTELYHSLSLTGYNNASLSFWYNIPSNGTGGQLQVGLDNGSFPPSNFLLTLSNTTNGWQQAQVNISYYANQSPTLQFYYTGSGGEGAFLDDIEVDTDTSVPADSTPPTAHLLGTLSDITIQQNAPLTFQVEYDDNLAVSAQSISSSNIAILENGASIGTAQLQSMVFNSNGSVDATYSYTPPDGQWDSNANGAYSLELQASSILDSSGNAAAQSVLGSFNVAIPAPYDSSVSAGQMNNSTGLAGLQLPQMVFNVNGPYTATPVDYTADIYLAAAGTIDAGSPGTLLGQIPFTYSSSDNQITLNPSAAGLTVPDNLPPGTYGIGVHINAPSLYPDTDDSNNWAITDTVTVQPALTNPTVVTVMVLYTQQTENSLGSDAAVKQQINTAIATTNTAFINSDIDVQLQLAYAGEVSYSETGDPSTDLVNLSQGSMGLTMVPSLREQYDADIVSLWTATTNNDTIGIAYIAGSSSDANLAYDVVVATQADAYTFAHEVGHNFGAGHAVGDSSGENSDNGLYDYSHGWRFTDSNGDQFHDIMAYPPGTTIPYYSNPDIDYLGNPTGTADANNALTINEDAVDVSHYGDPPTVTVSASAPVSSITEGSSTPGDFRVTATILETYDNPITVTVPLVYAGTPVTSDYGSPLASVSITIPAGSLTAFADIPITAIDDHVVGGLETLTMTVGSGTEYTLDDTTSASISITDIDQQGIVLSPASLNVPEGTSLPVQIHLGAEPIAVVTVSIGQGAGTVTVGLSETSLTFTPEDWDIDQILNVQAPQTPRPGNALLNFSASDTSASLNVTETNPAAPSIGSLAPTASTVSTKSNYQIVASNVAVGTDGGKFSITFFLDSTGTGVFSTSDMILGTDKSSAGGWTLKGKAKSLVAGNNVILAVATDAKGQSSGPVSCTLTVSDLPPVIKTFTAKGAGANRINALMVITAKASDPDGKVTRLVVWVDANGDGEPNDGEQEFTGVSSVRELVNVQLGQTYSLSAIAYDNGGAASAVKVLTFGG